MYNFKGFTQKANDALNGAIKVASELGHTYVGTEHLLLAILSDNDSYSVRFLRELGANTDNIVREISNSLNLGNGEDI